VSFVTFDIPLLQKDFALMAKILNLRLWGVFEEEKLKRY